MERVIRILSVLLVLILLICLGCSSVPTTEQRVNYEAGDGSQYPPPKTDYGSDLVWIDQDGDPLPFDTLDDILEFLKTSEPVKTETIKTGVNRPIKMLLKKGNTKANAIFRFESQIDGFGYTPFRDSYKGEIAAFEMNRLLGLNNIPPTIYRTINGMHGTLQLWAEGTIPEREIAQNNTVPPKALFWNRQIWDMRVFDNLINNIDRNQTNILIDPNWRLILIDHTRSFARDLSLPKSKEVIHCSRGLWYALRHLDKAAVRKRLTPYLSGREINAIFSRQELLIRHIQRLIDKKGEENVLFY